MTREVIALLVASAVAGTIVAESFGKETGNDSLPYSFSKSPAFTSNSLFGQNISSCEQKLNGK